MTKPLDFKLPVFFEVTKDVLYLNLYVRNSYLPTHAHISFCVGVNVDLNVTFSPNCPSSLTNVTHVSLTKHLLRSPSEKLVFCSGVTPWVMPVHPIMMLSCFFMWPVTSWGCFLLCSSQWPPRQLTGGGFIYSQRVIKARFIPPEWNAAIRK